MKRKWTPLAVGGLLAAAVIGLAVAQDKPAQADKPPPQRQADEAAIRANVEAFVKAYNAGNAKAIAALFTPDGQAVDDEGNTFEGREAIEQVFANEFADKPGARIEVGVDSIRFIGSDLAVEVGATKVAVATDETPEYGRYTVLHVKRDGKWLMALARDTEGQPPTNHERLQVLAWLVGEWMDESDDSVIFTSCRWSEDKNFLLQDMKVQVAGRKAMDVTQRIGWDPVAKRIRSWVFDSEGGFAEGVWARTEGGWIVKNTGVRADGTICSATNTVILLGKDAYVWRSADRIVGDEVMPPVEVRVVRKPPSPADAKK